MSLMNRGIQAMHQGSIKRHILFFSLIVNSIAKGILENSINQQKQKNLNKNIYESMSLYLMSGMSNRRKLSLSRLRIILYLFLLL